MKLAARYTTSKKRPWGAHIILMQVEDATTTGSFHGSKPVVEHGFTVNKLRRDVQKVGAIAQRVQQLFLGVHGTLAEHVTVSSRTTQQLLVCEADLGVQGAYV